MEERRGGGGGREKEGGEIIVKKILGAKMSFELKLTGWLSICCESINTCHFGILGHRQNGILKYTLQNHISCTENQKVVMSTILFTWISPN